MSDQTNEIVVVSQETDFALSVNGSLIPLSEAEQRQLEACEERISSGLEALWEIKENQLYRAYGTFNAYMSQRWGTNARRGNQIVAAYKAILVLTERLEGTDVPLPNNENQIRPLITMTVKNPEQAVQVWRAAVQLTGGGSPGHDTVMLSRRLELSPDEVRREDAVSQLKAMKRYDDLMEESRNGGDFVALVGLAAAYESCDPYVRDRLRKANVRDLSLIRLINDGYLNGREVAKEVLLTGAIQFTDGKGEEGEGVLLANATAQDYRRLTQAAWKEHVQKARDEKRGQAVSVVIFDGDAEGTLESLKQVLRYSTLIKLGALIGEM